MLVALGIGETIAVVNVIKPLQFDNEYLVAQFNVILLI